MVFINDTLNDMERRQEEERRRQEAEKRRQEEEARRRTTLEHGAELRGELGNVLNDVRNRTAPTVNGAQVGNVATYGGATIDPSAQAQFRGQQLDLASMLKRRAMGLDSVAGEQYNRAASRNMQQQAAFLAGNRGAQTGGAARRAAQNIVRGNQLAAQDAVAGRLAEQAQAQGQLNSLLASGRGQDIGLASNQAQLFQQANLANMSAENQRIFQQAGLDQATSLANAQLLLQQRGLDDRTSLATLAAMLGIDQAELAARMQQESINAQRDIAANNLNAQQSPWWADLLGAAGMAIGTAAALSDENQKKDKQPFDWKTFQQEAGRFDKALSMMQPKGSDKGRPLTSLARFGGTLALALKGRPQAPTPAMGATATPAVNAIPAPLLSPGSTVPGITEGMPLPEMPTLTPVISDERKKASISNISQDRMNAVMAMANRDMAGERRELDGMLSKLKPQQYRYKDPANGKGQQIGVMAQDLEKSKLGSKYVIDTPAGKMVDYGRMAGVQMAATSHIYDLVQQLKKELEKKGS